jgi:drug/metabolite transporter (DMT)-like permease
MGRTYCVIASILWASIVLPSFHLKMGGITPWDLVNVRIIGSAIALSFGLPYLVAGARIGMGKYALTAVAGIVGFILNFYFYFKTLTYIPAGLAVTLEYLAPIFLAIASLLIGKNFGLNVRRKITFTIVAFFGVALCMIPGFLNGGGDFNYNAGLFYGVLTAATLAAFSALNVVLTKFLSPLQILYFGMSSAAVLLVTLNSPHATWMKLVNSTDPHVWLWSVWLILFGSIGSFFFFLLGIKKIGALRASMIATLEPIFASFFSVLFLDQSLTWLQWVGVAIVVGAICGFDYQKKIPEPQYGQAMN